MNTKVTRRYRKLEALIDSIQKEFYDGASMARIGRKHSLPRSTVEFVIRMKMLGQADQKAKARRKLL